MNTCVEYGTCDLKGRIADRIIFAWQPRRGHSRSLEMARIDKS